MTLATFHKFALTIAAIQSSFPTEGWPVDRSGICEWRSFGLAPFGREKDDPLEAKFMGPASSSSSLCESVAKACSEASPQTDE